MTKQRLTTVIDLAGQEFGQLTVIVRAGTKHGHPSSPPGQALDIIARATT
jgi:hypothetical protein